MSNHFTLQQHQQRSPSPPPSSSTTLAIVEEHKNKRKMCDEPLSPSRLPPSNPRSQLQPTTPEKKITDSHLQKRMQGDTCFNCRQKGHWSPHCPLKKNPSSSSHSPNQHSYQNIPCRCGHGFCIIKTSKSERNLGRDYYACPVKRGAQCNYYPLIKWCDVPLNERDLQTPLFKYPECECGAGVCRREKGTEEITNAVKYYFVCPVKKDHGSCGYQVSEDEVLNNTSITPPIRESRQSSLDDFYQNVKTNIDLGEGGNSPGQTKRMRIMDIPENPSSMVISENPEGDNACAAVEADQSKFVRFPEYPSSMVISENPEGDDAGAAVEADQSKFVRFPEFEIADDDDDEFADLAINAEADLLPSLSTPSRISARQSAFDRDIADASFGRLVFVHPTLGLKLPAAQPLFCCVFPSFNPILVPKQASIIPNGPGECNNLAINSFNQHAQLSTTSLTEVSRDVVSSNTPPGSGNKPMAMLKIQRELALFAQQRLLSNLENLDPREQESMREAAETTFEVLDRLEVDHEQFSQHVWDFINLTSSIVEMDKSMENSLTLEEQRKLFEEEKMILDCIQDDFAETEALLEVSNRHRKSLCEEISHLETMLHEKKKQLESCEAETLQMETRLGDLKRSMLESDITVRDRAGQVDIARKQSEERQAKQVAAKTAMENAKLDLEN